jgi:hypothetical protein
MLFFESIMTIMYVASYNNTTTSVWRTNFPSSIGPLAVLSVCLSARIYTSNISNLILRSLENVYWMNNFGDIWTKVTDSLCGDLPTFCKLLEFFREVPIGEKNAWNTSCREEGGLHCVPSKDFGNFLWFSKLLKEREQIERKSENICRSHQCNDWLSKGKFTWLHCIRSPMQEVLWYYFTSLISCFI